MRVRIYFFYAILLIGLFILWGKTAHLQLILGKKNREIAEGNRIRKEILPAPRGLIYDRKGRELVRNIPVYKKCLGVNEKCEIISREEALRIEAKGGKEAENLKIKIGRDYVYGEILAHLLGYLGEANEEEVKSGRYNLGDLVGRMGIEEKYDRELRGKAGGEIYEVNALGEKIRQLGIQQPVAGQDLNLTVDAELSRVAFEALKGKPGAVIVTEVKTGAVLVLVSSPSFNPEKITPNVLNDSRQPMFNRAIAGVYPPGSTFKIITAVAGLEEGKINVDTLYEDTGEIRVGSYVYRNWYFTQYGKTEGKINVVQALKRSTDTFFYKLGEGIGPTYLKEWAVAFGLGKPTGIDLPGEAAGKLPDLSQNWFLGNTYHFAIGQGDLLTTPLQINVMTGVIANDGQPCRPQIVRNSSQKMKSGQNCQSLQLKPETLRLTKEGMKGACSLGGTAWPFFNFSPQVACKTGTAEFDDPQGRTHAWFTAFAPADNPQITITVLVEAGGEGSSVAAPIAKKVMEEWFGK